MESKDMQPVMPETEEWTEAEDEAVLAVSAQLIRQNLEAYEVLAQ